MVVQSVSRIWARYIYLWWFGFRLKPIFITAPAASKNNAQFKSSQNRLETNHFALLILIRDKLCRNLAFLVQLP
jgi:hypothetical protein